MWALLPLLVLAALAAYQPAWRGGILWDDNVHLTPAAMQTVDGLRRIWFELGATPQYYPVVHSVFWGLHGLLGSETLGYHLTNIALHPCSAFLVAVILRRLNVRGDVRYFRALGFKIGNNENVALDQFDFWRANIGLAIKF